VTILHRAGYVERLHTAAGSGVRILRPKDKDLSDFNFEELDRRRAFEHRKLAMMLQYASRFKKHCYRSFVLRYFGEWNNVRDCQNCSRCAPEKRLAAAVECPEMAQMAVAAIAPPVLKPKAKQAANVPAADSTIVALKILSCILRASEQLGREKIAKILAGSNDTSIQTFRGLTTYGILSEYPIRAIVALIDFLIGEGYIDTGEGFRPTIRVTPKGRQFLKDRVPIIIPL
jgi:ATP-dependent DNA helicase RecQ